MANLETLRKQAEEAGLEIADGATKAEIQALLDELKQGSEVAEVAEVAEGATEEETPAPDTEDSAPTAPTGEYDERNHQSEPAVQAAADISAATAIGEAIAKGLSDAKEGKKMVVTTDESVVPRFSLVRDKATGEVLTRENETGVITALQLKSLEEKQRDLQGLDVEEV